MLHVDVLPGPCLPREPQLLAGSLCPALVSADGQLRDAAAALDLGC